MARVGIVFGLLLCGLTIAGLVGTVSKAPAQFIPMMFGIPIFFCGVVALTPTRLKYSMHSAATVGLIGVLVGGGLAVFTGMRLSDGVEINAYVFKLVLAMAILCLVFVGICTVSFLQARKSIKPDTGSAE